MSNEDLVKKVVQEAIRNVDLSIEYWGMARGQLKALDHVEHENFEQWFAKAKILRQNLNRSLKSG